MASTEEEFPFRLMPDGSIGFRTLKAALVAQRHFLNRLNAVAAPPTRKRQTRHAVPPLIRVRFRRIESGKRSGMDLSLPSDVRTRLPEEDSILTEQQRRILDWLYFYGKEIATVDIPTLYPQIGRDPTRAMSGLRAALVEAGYADGTVLSSRTAGFGAEKKTYYKPGSLLVVPRTSEETATD